MVYEAISPTHVDIPQAMAHTALDIADQLCGHLGLSLIDEEGKGI